ncbi:MAG: ankyrin repeat domain-containing protein [Oceanobacter sp.]
MRLWNNITVEEAEIMMAESKVLLLDMRDYKAWLAGHHPDAIHLHELNLRSFLKHTSRSVPVLIYCYHGHKSQDMAQLFSDFGFTSCYSLDGGYEAWCPQMRQPDNDLSRDLKRWMVDQNFHPNNLDLRGDNNETALMVAAREGLESFCRELVFAGASLDNTNKDGNNALWMAVQSGSGKIVQLLLDNDINFDNQNDHGATPLIYAASLGYFQLVNKLVEAGADTRLTTADGFTAADVASTRQVLMFLMQRQHVLNFQPSKAQLAVNSGFMPRTHYSIPVSPASAVAQATY